MSIQDDVRKSEVPAFLELFEIDLTDTNVTELIGSVIRVTAMTDSTDLTNIQQVNWGGNTYMPFPIAISGISQTSDGAPARPTLSIANIDKTIGQLAFIYNDVVGAKVTYIRTFAPYLNLTSSISLPPMKFFISKKSSHTRTGLSFELRSPLDKERAFLPKRQMLKSEFPGLGINKHIR